MDKLVRFIPLILLLQISHALKSDYFINGFYYQETIHGIEYPEYKDNLAPMTCSGICMKLTECAGFTVQSKTKCLFLQESSIAKLVKSSRVGTKSKEVWVKESLLGNRIPHLLVIAGNGKLQDISFDAEISPPINYNIQIPKDNGLPGPYIVDRDMSLILLKFGATGFLSWNFDDQTPMSVPNPALPTSIFRTAMTTSQSGRNFFLRSYKAFTLVNRKIITLNDFTYDYSNGCAAFVPDNDNDVFIVGGSGSGFQKFVYKYQFSTNDYTNLDSDVPGVSGGIARHACTGVQSSNGDKLIVVIGGELGTSFDNAGPIDTVRTFNVETKQWGLWPSYPVPVNLHRTIFAGGYIYASGGLDDDDKYIKKIFRMQPSADGSWEEFSDMDAETENPILVLYNT